ncbi:mitochondrial fission ELM1 family protein [Rhizobiaceae bacterium]|nr:mitochondrial fission ELM1 family protein [Rhizobiaceae bacterium]
MPRLTVWILTDGKIGDLVQCRGIAAQLDAAEVVERVVRPEGMWSLPLPFLPVPPADRPARAASPITPPFPDLVLASGRRTVPYLAAIRRSSREPLLVFLKDPRWWGRRVVDLMWAPIHDGVNADGAKVIATHTSPHLLTAERLAAARIDPPFPAAKGSSTGIILGGDSGTVRWTAETAAAFAKLLASAVTDRALITTSRRTPAVLRDEVAAALPKAWQDPDGSAYPAILALADRLVVTGDSHNMVSEALATGAPVHVFRPPGLQSKLERFLDAMEASGAIAPLAAPMQDSAGQRIDATQDIATAIRKRLP